MSDRSIEQMMTNICECITTNNQDIEITGYSVEQDANGQPVAFIESLYTRVYLTHHDPTSSVIAEFTYEDPTCGDVRKMDLIAGSDRDGDFDVADTILDQIR